MTAPEPDTLSTSARLAKAVRERNEALHDLAHAKFQLDMERMRLAHWREQNDLARAELASARQEIAQLRAAHLPLSDTRSEHP